MSNILFLFFLCQTLSQELYTRKLCGCSYSWTHFTDVDTGGCLMLGDWMKFSQRGSLVDPGLKAEPRLLPSFSAFSLNSVRWRRWEHLPHGLLWGLHVEPMWMCLFSRVFFPFINKRSKLFKFVQNGCCGEDAEGWWEGLPTFTKHGTAGQGDRRTEGSPLGPCGPRRDPLSLPTSPAAFSLGRKNEGEQGCSHFLPTCPTQCSLVRLGEGRWELTWSLLALCPCLNQMTAFCFI